MPKRTNPFQQLVTLVQTVLAPRGTKVTSSAMIMVEGLGALREIDVLIESSVGPYDIRIAVEAKDHRRKLTVTDIEAIIGKYRGAGNIVVHKVVVIAQRGFTKTAIKRATLEGIELLTLEQANTTAAARKMVTPPVHRSGLSAMDTQIVNVSTQPPIPLNERHLGEGRIFCKCCDRDHGTLARLAQYLFSKHTWNDPLMRRELLKGCQQFPKGRVATLTYTTDKFVFRSEVGEFEIHRIVVGVLARVHHAATTSQRYDLRDASGTRKQTLLHQRHELDGVVMTLVTPDSQGPHEVCMNFEKNSKPLFTVQISPVGQAGNG